jgi:hypothetical protein
MVSYIAIDPEVRDQSIVLGSYIADCCVITLD